MNVKILHTPLYYFLLKFNYPRILPMNYVISLTYKCNSNCKTCFIWQLYKKKPNLVNRELSFKEFEKIFKSIGKNVFWVTLGGGEPFLREDISEIVNSLQKYCSPQIINIPTNGLLTKTIKEKMESILSRNNKLSYFILNLSLDGLGKKHDKIRGVKNNFAQLIYTYRELKKLQNSHKNLYVGFNTVISKYNINNFYEIYKFVNSLKPDSYLIEIAENRDEFLNIDRKIFPDFKKYLKVVNLMTTLSKSRETNKFVPLIIRIFRNYYYSLTTEIFKNKKQVRPCYAGFASCHINPYGDVWPCCVLGRTKSMGNLRKVNYNFKKIWFSKKADEIRKFIKNKNCYCYSANIAYTNIFCNFTLWPSIIKNAFKIK